MRPTDRQIRRLTLVNSAILAIGMMVAAVIVFERRDAVLERLAAVVPLEDLLNRFDEAASSFGKTPGEELYPSYELFIEQDVLADLQEQIARLRESSVMTDELKIWHAARFAHDGETYDVKIRLRGDFMNHWIHEKKSWRVRFERDAPFEGRREIDLIIPLDKAYEVELIAYDAARELGLLVPDAGFCNVRINGFDYGAYTWIERFDAAMLARSGRERGEIFRNQNVWTQTLRTGFGLDSSLYTGAYENVVRKDSSVGRYAARWDELMVLVREGTDEEFESRIEELVDIEKFLRWNALTWLFGSTHAHGIDNLRWFYDDGAGLFEPILYDVDRRRIRQKPARALGRPQWRFPTGEVNSISLRILGVTQWRHRRNEILWEMLDDEKFDLVAASRRSFEIYEPVLSRGIGSDSREGVRGYQRETVDMLTQNRESLRGILSFDRVFMTPSLEDAEGTPAVGLRIVPDSQCALSVDEVEVEFASGAWAETATQEIAARLIDPEGRSRPITVTGASRSGASRVAVELSGAHVHAPVSELLAPLPGEWTVEIAFGALEREAWKRPGAVVDLDVAIRNVQTDTPLAEGRLFSSPIVYRFSD